MHSWDIGLGRLIIRQGDITTFEVDAIVNAANPQLAGGGGVDGAIHHAAGADSLQTACRAIIADIGELPVGEAVITPGFDLSAKHIVHTVGPIWSGGTENEPALLANAYANSLKLTHEHGARAIAFPAISCGVYGYPVEAAARVALNVLKQGLEHGLADEASMVLYGDETYAAWATVAHAIFTQET